MKIAVACQNQHKITEHTGRCRRFWVYDLENGDLRDSSTELDQLKQFVELSNQQTFQQTPPQASHPLDGIQVLIARHFGWGLTRHLQSRGIQPITTAKTDPDAAIWDYFDNSQPENLPNRWFFGRNGRRRGNRRLGRGKRGNPVGASLVETDK